MPSTKTAVIQIRIDEEDKKQLEKTLRRLGLTTSQAGLLYFKQILLKGKIPLELSASSIINDQEISQKDFRKTQAKIVDKFDSDEEIENIWLSSQTKQEF